MRKIREGGLSALLFMGCFQDGCLRQFAISVVICQYGNAADDAALVVF